MTDMERRAREIIDIFVDESDVHIFAEVITILRAVEAETIERAAKVAEEHASISGLTAGRIATAIRALQDEQTP